ncbi:MAG: hypothetical protein ACKVON_11185, partial [Beijerinckiaceae bacterium]
MKSFFAAVFWAFVLVTPGYSQVKREQVSDAALLELSLSLFDDDKPVTQRKALEQLVATGRKDVA